jgi:hypothetical protein
LTGAFHACEFCALDTTQRDLLRVFLASRGNVRELERHLGVSYPTARARVDDLLRALGLNTPDTTPDAGPPADEPGTPAVDGPAAAREGQPAGQASAQDARLATLRDLASGELDLEQARRLLGG